MKTDPAVTESLRERLLALDSKARLRCGYYELNAFLDEAMPIIEAELQKRDKEKARLVETAVRLLKAWRATQWSPFGGGPLTGLNDDTADFCREHGSKP